MNRYSQFHSLSGRIGRWREAEPLLHVMEWPALHFAIDAPDVLAENADEHELHSTQKQDRDEQRRPSRNPCVDHQANDEAVDDAEQGQSRRIKPNQSARRNGMREKEKILSAARRSSFLGEYLGNYIE